MSSFTESSPAEASIEPAGRRDDHFLIVIDGPIAAGKTTLLRSLHATLQGWKCVRFVTEPLEDWTAGLDMLGNMMKDASFDLDPRLLEELARFQDRIFDHHKRVAQMKTPTIVVTERGLKGAEVFIRALHARNWFPQAYLDAKLDEIRSIEEDPACKPALTCVLRCSVDDAMERIRVRASQDAGRSFELKYDREYIELLHAETDRVYNYPRESDCMIFVDASLSTEKMSQAVMGKLDKILALRGSEPWLRQTLAEQMRESPASRVD